MPRAHKIIDGLKDAIAGNFARVTIDGQTWVRKDASEWRPIETAPKGDDDFFLVCGAGDPRSPFVVRGSILRSDRRADTPSHLHLRYLTHWMPLPSPPSPNRKTDNAPVS